MEHFKTIAAQLKRSFDSYHTFSIEFWESIMHIGDIITVEKDTTLKEPFQTENYFYFLIEGCGGILLWNNKDFVCTDLILELDFICDYLSLITRKKTPYEVKVFEKSVLFRISYVSLTNYLIECGFNEVFWRHATEAIYIEKNLQFIQLESNTTENILRIILQHHPEITFRIPVKYIASYLRITTQHLSRITKVI